MDTVLITTVASALSSMATWFVARKKRNNDFIAELQSSIDLLSERNRKLLEENLELRKKVVDLEVYIHSLKGGRK
ncbi:MAG: hypothetical protein LBF04_03840 [Prevotellaceae bacterium]|jgi:hypothetical protein|nr:hypothetical protein [Prevotellaceae bacterium]